MVLAVAVMRIDVEKKMMVVTLNQIPRFKEMRSDQENTHIPLVSNCGYFKIKCTYYFPFNLYVFFQKVTELLGQEYLLGFL